MKLLRSLLVAVAGSAVLVVIASTLVHAPAPEAPATSNSLPEIPQPAAPPQEAKGPKSVERIGVMSHQPLREVSGIVKSETYDGVWWVHNDSGDKARFFAVDAEGDVIFPERLGSRYHGARRVAGQRPWPGHLVHGAVNFDWEDIALSEGRLYLADMGNNRNNRRDLGVYVVNEPNPREIQDTRKLTFYPIRYPDQHAFPPEEEIWEFDSEALFVDDGTLYMLTKHRPAGELDGMSRGTKLYRLDTMHTDKENVLTLIERHNSLPVPTGACLSPDGSKLAVLCYSAVYVFERPAEGDRWLSDGRGHRLRLPVHRTLQAEAITWDDDKTLRIANEQRSIFRIEVGALSPVD